jgi:hypothetical protein
VDPHWFQCGPGSGILSQCGSGIRMQIGSCISSQFGSQTHIFGVKSTIILIFFSIFSLPVQKKIIFNFVKFEATKKVGQKLFSLMADHYNLTRTYLLHGGLDTTSQVTSKLLSVGP